MAFVKLTGTDGKPLLLKYELIESVREYVIGRLSYGDIVATEEYATEIPTNQPVVNTMLKKQQKKLEKALGGTNDILKN